MNNGDIETVLVNTIDTVNAGDVFDVVARPIVDNKDILIYNIQFFIEKMRRN
jgi:hypothetical protein